MNFMGDIEICRLREEDFPAAVRVEGYAFGEHPTDEEIGVYRAAFNVDRTFCAVEQGALVGTASVMEMELTLPGEKVIPVAALTWVAVLPTHRRRGILRRLMECQFEDMRLRGDAVSVLLASETGIYGRFGYAPATSVSSFTLDRSKVTLTQAGGGGRMTLIEHGEAASLLPEVYDKYRRRQPGAMSRHPGWWTEHLYDMEHHRDGADEMFHAIHEDATGARDGYISYRIKLAWTSVVPRRELEVVELIALHAKAYRDLWGYCLGLDLVDTVSFRTGQVDEPLRWLVADARTFQVRGLSDYLWARLLDVPRALAARDYLSPGDLVFELRDDFLPDNSRCYRLHVAAGRGEVGCATDSPDPALALSAADLAAAYLGGVSFRTLAAAGRVRELRPGAVALADSMFAAEAQPYCVTMF